MGKKKGAMSSIAEAGKRHYGNFVLAAEGLEELMQLIGFEKLEELRLALLSSELELPSFECSDPVVQMLWIGRNIDARDENSLVIADVEIHIHWVGSTWAIQSNENNIGDRPTQPYF